MDAHQELSPTEQPQEHHHQVSGSSDYPGTPVTASEIPSPGQHLNPGAGLSHTTRPAPNSKPPAPTGSHSCSPRLKVDNAAAMDTRLCSAPPSNSEEPPSPRPSRLSSPCHQEMDGYYADLQALMGTDGGDYVHMMDSDASAGYNPGARDDNEHRAGAANMDDGGSSDDSRQSYRHGQMGVFKHFPRFDQASRPIVSGNWRDKKAAGPPLSALMTSSGGVGNISRPLSPITTPGHSRGNTLDATGSASQQRSPFVYTPSRSPLNAPANPNIAGFQSSSSPNPPPTPVSLSTPISMAFPRGSGSGSGYGHAHHSSAGSFGTSNSYSPTSASATSTDLITRQVSSLALRSNDPPSSRHANDQQTSSGAGSGSGTGTGHVNSSKDGKATFPVAITADTLGYCFVRSNGRRTRLVPVDMLPYALRGIPAHESGDERLVALPLPAGVGRDGRSSNSQVLTAAASSAGSANGGGDAIQSHIDRILAAPPSHQHHHTNSPNQPRQQLTPTQSPLHNHNHNHSHSQTHNQLQTQNHNNNTNNTHTLTHTHSQNSAGGNGTAGNNKRLKIYCDKWVHEGVCAFTQQGCKYKHEMPSDTATQHQLGLFLGYPVWWKRRMQELARVQTPSSLASEGGAGGGQGGEGGGVGGRDGGRGDTGGVRGAGSGLGERGGGRFMMIAGSSSRLGDGGAGGGLGSGLGGGGGGRLGNVGGNEVRFAAGSVDGEGGHPSGLLSSQLPRPISVVPSGGLAASRWSNGPARDKVLPPSWRAAASTKGSPQSPYAEQTLQTYDGASSVDGREPVPYPWDEQHYNNLRAVQTQTQQQQQQQHPQSQPGNEGSAFNAACNFAFHAPSPASSPYGPIAPPLRSPIDSSGPIPAAAPAREIANPYAYAPASASTSTSAYAYAYAAAAAATYDLRQRAS